MDPPLPPGWSAARDPASGRTYYYEHATRRTAWTRPAASEEAEEQRKRVAAMHEAIAHAHAKRKLQPLLAPQVSDALGGAARASTAAAAEALKQRPHGESIFRSALLMTGGEARPEGRARRLA